MSTYNYHPLSTVFPIMNEIELRELAEDIKENGLKQPIILYENQILDGRNRHKACQIAGVEPVFTDYSGSNAVGHVISLNLQRRHLTAGQKACVALEILPYIQASKKKGKDTSKQVYTGVNILKSNISVAAPYENTSLYQAAKLAGSTYPSVNFLRKLKRKSPEIFEKVKSGGYKIQDAKRNVAKMEHEQKICLRETQPLEEIKGPFDVILADPPWQYDFAETCNREIENQYPTAPLDVIKSHVPDCSQNCILFLWATSPKLVEALEVLKAWGFQYKTHAIWDKEILGMGYWFRGQHELLLVGTKGNASPPPESERVSSIFKERREKHSVKPQSVYQWIERAFPGEKKLEMYCRNPRQGWAVWGNEI